MSSSITESSSSIGPVWAFMSSDTKDSGYISPNYTDSDASGQDSFSSISGSTEKVTAGISQKTIGESAKKTNESIEKGETWKQTAKRWTFGRIEHLSKVPFILGAIAFTLVATSVKIAALPITLILNAAIEKNVPFLDHMTYGVIMDIVAIITLLGKSIFALKYAVFSPPPLKVEKTLRITNIKSFSETMETLGGIYHFDHNGMLFNNKNRLFDTADKILGMKLAVSVMFKSIPKA